VRAVLDPNVIISGLPSSKGAPARVLAAWDAGEFELVASPLLFEELKRSLAYPKVRKYIAQPDAEAAIRWLIGSAVPRSDREEQPSIRSADPGDDYLVALAQAERAALVSGDKHLLDLADRLPVLSATQFLKLLEDR
jgi:putative PIN family toxin of toxin-antitoxin system